MFLAPQALDWEDGSDAIMLANVLRTYMVAVELGARRQGDVNCMAFAAMRLDTTIHFAFLIAMLCPTGAPPQTTGERMMLLYLLNSLIFLIADWGRPFLNKDGETFAASIGSALPFLVVATTARAARLQRCLKVFSNMKMETLPPKLEERGPFLLESAYGVLFLTQTVRFFLLFCLSTTTLLPVLGHLGRVRAEPPQPGRGQGWERGHGLWWALDTVFWDGFETANTDGVLSAPVSALRERSQMTILSTESDPFDKIEDDVRIFVLFHIHSNLFICRRDRHASFCFNPGYYYTLTSPAFVFLPQP